ncbi:MAG: hypothetical protein NTW29_07815 [Bacteroidetes bacterium]|nr:hypothetical protein [Bacteroidota bacterium]
MERSNTIRLMAFLGLILAGTLFFWFRFLYIRSLRTAEKRETFGASLQHIFPYIPLGLHAAFLFCYAVIQFRFLYIKLAALFGHYVLGKKDIDTPDIFPLKLLFAASLLIALYYLLLRSIRTISHKATKLILHGILFTAGCYSLKVLVLNIKWSAGLSYELAAPVSYGNGYLWVCCLVFTFFVSITHGINIRPDSGFKYVALTSRLLWLYCLVAFFFAIPRILIFAFQ